MRYKGAFFLHLRTLNHIREGAYLMRGTLRNFDQSVARPFSIVQAFSLLTPKVKTSLCDHLFTHGNTAFSLAAKRLWPQSDEHDVKKLEAFLTLLKKTSH